MCIVLQVKCPLFLPDFKWNLYFMYKFEGKNSQISNFLKIRSVGAEDFRADGQMDRDMTKVTVAFRNFANAPKNLFVEWILRG